VVLASLEVWNYRVTNISGRVGIAARVSHLKFVFHERIRYLVHPFMAAVLGGTVWVMLDNPASLHDYRPLVKKVIKHFFQVIYTPYRLHPAFPDRSRASAEGEASE
jgi:hypothetical protein